MLSAEFVSSFGRGAPSSCGEEEAVKVSGRKSGWSRLNLPLTLAALPALLLTAGAIYLVAFDAGLRGELVVAWRLLLQGEPEALRTWLVDFGPWAPVISALLQVATSLIPFLPGFVLAIANAMIWGAVLGGTLTFASAIVAAAACFGLSRILGRPGVERIVRRESLERVDDFMENHGVMTIFLGRLIPFINPDILSYAAGVTKIGWIPFLLAMAGGALPATVFYSLVGALAVDAAGWVIGVVLLAASLPLVLLWFFRDRLRG
jgi:uncharacterized membrane protein YdjX (TVP38/TMEM64 family)